MCKMTEEDDDFEIEWVASIRYPRIDDEVFTRDIYVDNEYEQEYILRQKAINLLKQFQEYERIREEEISRADG